MAVAEVVQAVVVEAATAAEPVEVAEVAEVADPAKAVALSAVEGAAATVTETTAPEVRVWAGAVAAQPSARSR